MVVRLRLARFGRKVRLSLVQVWQVCLLKCITAVLQHLPFYRIFAADARAPRDGKHLEVVGHYDPLPGQNRLGLLPLHHLKEKGWGLDQQPTGCREGWQQAHNP